jgi:hypothetical protein
VNRERKRIHDYAREYETFRAAHEGDFAPLIQLLSSGAEITAECRELIIQVLRGDITRPHHRQARITTAIRRREIAAYVRRREANGIKQTSAVAEAKDKFGCCERTIKNALKLEYGKARDRIVAEADRIVRSHGRETLFLVVDRLKRKLDEDSLRFGQRKFWWKPLIWET